MNKESKEKIYDFDTNVATRELRIPSGWYCIHRLERTIKVWKVLLEEVPNENNTN